MVEGLVAAVAAAMAGQVTKSGIETGTARLARSRLERTDFGRGRLRALALDPYDPQMRELLAQALRDEVLRDPRFRADLERAAANERVYIAPADHSVRRQGDIRISGFGRGGNVVHGHKTNLTGLPVMIVAVVAILVISGGVYGAKELAERSEPEVRLEQIVGDWSGGGGKVGPVTVGETTLKVGADGAFTIATSAAVGVGSGMDQSITCSGRASADRDRFTLRSTVGGCKNVYATLSADGDMLDIRADTGESQALSRVR